MKKTLLFLSVLFYLINSALAQPIECGNGVFYGLSSNSSIYKMTLSGNTITLNGMVVPAPSYAMYALAISGFGTETNAFFSSKNNNELLKYDGTQWQVIFTDTAVFHNGAGNDNVLYYHQYGSPSPTSNRISRYNGGSVTTMWNDPVQMSVSDIAVDSVGNVYFFTGQNGNHLLHVMSPSGNIANSYPVSFSNSTPYGCLFMDGTLYVGVGATNIPANRLLLPITFSAGTATVGTGIQMPAPVIGGTVGNPQYLDFKDLANCHPRNTLPVTLLAFNAEHINATLNKLKWKVTNEVDMKYYEPQYSTDGIRFTAIDKIAANTSSFDGVYVYEHNGNMRGKIFYRLKLIDKQGKAQYSKIVKLAAGEHTIGALYPNPVKDKLYVEYSGSAATVTIKVTDAVGRIVYSGKIPASATIPVTLNFPAGQCAITIMDDENILTKKLVKQ